MIRLEKASKTAWEDKMGCFVDLRMGLGFGIGRDAWMGKFRGLEAHATTGAGLAVMRGWGYSCRALHKP